MKTVSGKVVRHSLV